MIGVVSAVWCLSLAALFVLWLRRPHSVIDIWLMVVLCAWLFDIALSAILNVARFDLGFYLGRIYGLCAASFVLAVLLIDNVAPAGADCRACSAMSARQPPPNRDFSTRSRAAVQRRRGILQRCHHHQIARRHHHRLEPRRRTAVRLSRRRGRRPAYRPHRAAGPARRDRQHPRSHQPRRADRAITRRCACTRTAAASTSR